MKMVRVSVGTVGQAKPYVLALPAPQRGLNLKTQRILQEAVYLFLVKHCKLILPALSVRGGDTACFKVIQSRFTPPLLNSVVTVPGGKHVRGANLQS